MGLAPGTIVAFAAFAPSAVVALVNALEVGGQGLRAELQPSGCTTVHGAFCGCGSPVTRTLITIGALLVLLVAG